MIITVRVNYVFQYLVTSLRLNDKNRLENFFFYITFGLRLDDKYEKYYVWVRLFFSYYSHFFLYNYSIFILNNKLN